MTSNNEPTAIMATYFDCWRQGDLATLRTILADGFSFRGPLGQVDNADDGVEAICCLMEMTTDVVVRKVFADGSDVLTWFELQRRPRHRSRWPTGATSATARSTGSGRRSTRGRCSGGRRGRQAASWNTRPSVNRCPVRITDTPCRTGAADQPRCERTGRSRVVNTSP
jgi:hypothetical protein